MSVLYKWSNLKIQLKSRENKFNIIFMKDLEELFSCFLGYKEIDVDKMLYWDFPLQKGGRQYLDSTMTGITYQTKSNPSVMFIIIFDTDFNGEAVIQKTTWGELTRKMYESLYQKLYCGRISAVSDGFIIETEKFGDLLIEMQQVNGLDFIVVNREGTF